MGKDPNAPRHEKPIEPFACPEGERLWNLYRESVPWGLTVPPVAAEDVTESYPELDEYLAHVAGCEDCNEL
jgi:hypothetical protein